MTEIVTLQYKQARTFTAAGITVGGTPDGITHHDITSPADRAAFEAFLADGSTKHQMAYGGLSVFDPGAASAGKVFGIEDVSAPKASRVRQG